MGGKASILLVMGFSLIFLVFGHNFGNISTRSSMNLNNYYIKTNLHNIAVSTANIVSNTFFKNQTQANFTKKIDLFGGSSIYSLSTIDAVANIKQLDIVSYFGKEPHVDSTSISVQLKPSSFSKFAYFSNYEPNNIWWMNKDTVWGPFHTNGNLQAYRHPTFFGKVTIKNRLKYYSSKSKDKPYFHNGFEKGVDIPMPTDGVSNLKTIAASGGAIFTGQDSVFLKFEDKDVSYRYSSSGSWTKKKIGDIAPNGVLFAENAVLSIQGQIDGKVSVGASGSSSGKGTVYLTDDIVYKDDPRTKPSSNDYLGIVAQQNVYIKDNSETNDIKINAAIYCENGGFGTENYAGRDPSGYINLYGGITQKVRRAVGKFSGGSITKGFAKRYRYDGRFMNISPPYFPGTNSFEIISWLE